MPFEVPLDVCFSRFVEELIQPYVVNWSANNRLIVSWLWIPVSSTGMTIMAVYSYKLGKIVIARLDPAIQGNHAQCMTDVMKSRLV